MKPKNPFHPGEILLEEFLIPSGVTQALFAEKLGWTKARLSELIHGKRGMTADAAIDLGKILGTTAQIWMNLQTTYDLDQAYKRRSTSNSRKIARMTAFRSIATPTKRVAKG
jgi:antitoxin HigA-1